jgi:phosphoglycerate-specific signal transduction histidine kinase
VRSTLLASILLVLAAGVLTACGQSKADKARDQVCEARDDIGQQVESLQELTLTTATTEKVQNSLQAIQSDLKSISSASEDLSADRKKDVQAANDEFTTKMTQIAQDFGNSLSIEGAATQAKAALEQLAQSYRSTFGQLDCS